jgi:hypothetical protein
MQNFAKHTRVSAILSGFLLLAACGGGGGGTTAPVTPAAPPPPPTKTLKPVTFSDQTATWGVQHSSGFSAGMNGMVAAFSGGAAAGDVDNDGDIDVFVVRGDTQPNLLYINQSGMLFREEAATAGLDYTNGAAANYRHSGPTFADMDGDNDLDLFIGGLEGDPSLLFRNNGDGTFTDVTAGSGIDTMTSLHTISAAFGDYDKDGDLDLAMAHWGTPRNSNAPGETETLWRNDTDASGIKFRAVSAGAGISGELALDLAQGVLGGDHDYTFAPSFADINNDTWPDLLSVSDFDGSRVFLNNRDGTFSNITDTSVITDENGMGSAIGDYDNDGDLDWFVSSINGNRLYRNDNGTFANVSAEAGILAGGWGWGSCFADFNADGALDIYQTNGWQINLPADSEYLDDTSRLWLSNGAGGFTDEAEASTMLDEEQGRGVVCADFDNDGDTDVLLLTEDDTQAAIFWENQLAANQYLRVTLRGPRPNTHGIGARILVVNDGVTQMREVGINSNFTSHNPARQIFSVDDATSIDEVIVRWPDGTEVRQQNVAPDQEIVFEHPDF